MKCSKCGQEFEGKFCPNCGEPADGSQRSTDAIAPSDGRAKVPAVVGKMYAHMPKIFSILFAVFAALMLICYAGNVTKSELLEAFGDSDSVYYYISESGEESSESWEDELALADDLDLGDEDVSGVSEYSLCAALVAFGVIAAALAAVGLAFAMYVPLGTLKFKVGDRTFKVKSIIDIASLVILFVIFLLGCILCANVGDDLGLTEPGAAPICIIFFSLFFGFLTASALFGRKLITLVWHGAKEEYEAQKEAARAKLSAPLEPADMGNSIKPSEYITPAEVNASLTDEEKKKISKFVKIRQIVAYIIFLPYLLIIGSVIAIAHYASRSKLNFWRVQERSAIIGAIIISLLSVVGWVMSIFATISFRPMPLSYPDYGQLWVFTRGENEMTMSEVYKQFWLFSSEGPGDLSDLSDEAILSGITNYKYFGVIYSSHVVNAYQGLLSGEYEDFLDRIDYGHSLDSYPMGTIYAAAKKVKFSGNDLKVAKRYEEFIEQIRSQYKSGTSEELLLSEIADNRDIIDEYCKLYKRIETLGHTIPFYMDLIIRIAIFVLSIVLLVKSNKYTELVFGNKRVKLKPVKKDKNLYQAELKAYKEYKRDRFNYLVEKAYYEEGIARK